MYLSRLDIFGFKSFAQKVALTFDSGISAIVGPNGCGKTNIVDAIRWVLGEQRYSALRSEKMEDVIFNGTKARKPLGMSEVSLVIENTKGILPSEYSQITIGRRVYRSGESEYLLNRTPCRLKDILDLFMDTGMGSGTYSVIELKMVETILSDRTDERRRLFEEAAGVTRYKHQRKAAYRKLESVQADLVRVNDIVQEVQKAVGTLERQARRAEQFNELRDRLRALEVDLMEREFANLIARIRPLEERVASLRDEKQSLERRMEVDEETLESQRTQLVEAEARQHEAQRDLSRHLEEVHRVEEKNLVSAERTRALRAQLSRLAQEDRLLLEERSGHEARLVQLGSAIALLEENERRAHNELEGRQEALRAFEGRLDVTKHDLQGINDQIIALVHAIANEHSAIDRSRERIVVLDERLRRGQDDTVAYQGEISRLEQEVAELTQEDRQLRRAYAEAEMRFYEADGQKRALKERIDQLERTIHENMNAVHRETSRMDFLKGLVESREGYSEGVRYLARAGGWSSATPMTVADAVHAGKEHRTAVEAALGEYAGCLVVPSAEIAEQGIALLKQDRRGKATFIALDRLPEFHVRLRAPELPGVVGWATDLVNFAPELAPLFQLLFDRTLVVDSAATAREVIRTLSGVRCVTLDGEVITGLGVTRGGSRRGDEGGTIGIRQQIEELEKEIVSLGKTLASVRQEREAVVAEEEALDLRPLSEAVKGIEKEMTGVEMRIAQLEFEKKRAADQIERHASEEGLLREERKALDEEISRRIPALENLKERKAEVEQRAADLRRELDALEGEWTERSGGVQELGIEVVRLGGELRNARNDEVRARSLIAGVDESMGRHRRETEEAMQEIAQTDASVGDNSLLLEHFVDRREELEQRLDEVREQTRSLRAEIHRIELQLKDVRRSSDETLRSLHELELRISDLSGKMDHLRARAVEEFEHTLELKSYPDEEFVDFASLQQTVQQVRDRIKNLGNINFAAFEEYRTEKQRLDFLTEQRNDLQEAERTLVATIEEINATAQQKFLSTFALIRTNFIETFKSLFDPGDECDLKLEEDMDPLEAGIEIIAKPRGKRPTSIDLLSGGEKTLTATALLFAIYLVKPSPFCILDEVDAPLDDANIDRFTRILRKFSDNTQFIVVTHNKRTMEAANALYGVTMEEEGVSKIVTVRFNQGNQVQAAAVASA